MATKTLSRSMTYGQFCEEINYHQLRKGEWITITDFQTVHVMFDGTDICMNQEGYYPEVNMGSTEPLTVRAISSGAIARVAKSELYPGDIIYYDWNAYNFREDRGYAYQNDPLENMKGVIYYRKDTINDNIFGYDFRNVKHRRWKFNYPAWDELATYSEGDRVQVPGNGAFMSAVNNNTGIPLLDGTSWIKLADYRYSDYWCLSSAQASDPTDYVDVLTFAEAPDTDNYRLCVFGNHFTTFKDTLENFFYARSLTGSLLDNNVFYLPLTPGQYAVNNNRFGAFFQLNTICAHQFEGNTFGIKNEKNLFGIKTRYNHLGDCNSENIFGEENTHNRWGNSNQLNILGKQNTYNSFGHQNQYNKLHIGCNYNTLGHQNQYNILAFADNNTMGNGNQHNSLLASSHGNTLGTLNQYIELTNVRNSTFGNENTNINFIRSNKHVKDKINGQMVDSENLWQLLSPNYGELIQTDSGPVFVYFDGSALVAISAM